MMLFHCQCLKVVTGVKATLNLHEVLPCEGMYYVIDRL